MLSKHEDRIERERVLRNDARVREQQGRVFAEDQSLPPQATTMHQFAVTDAEMPLGRFSAISNATVVGSTAIPQYPQASAPFQCDPVGDEPPLGLENPAFEPEPSISSPGDAQVAGASVSGDVPSLATPFAGDVERDTGAPPRFRRRV
jgi:hypothetical protein